MADEGETRDEKINTQTAEDKTPHSEMNEDTEETHKSFKDLVNIHTPLTISSVI